MLKISVDTECKKCENGVHIDISGMDDDSVAGEFALAYHYLVDVFSRCLGVEYDVGQIALMDLAMKTDNIYKETCQENLTEDVSGD